ncbi:MAG: ABC transporter substrate-binding protein [Peptoniphilus sp.]|nr:ABC transporter substrate-binding protein [Peptoniphilus sp.]MDD7362723.1 ABC transporter substrate-binding protein [Bacillota bacterium]MDY6044583.1 ABC transporter substrate-binding protein [Peptoniphilus sp.]
MKKIIPFILALCMLTMTACAGSGQSAENGKKEKVRLVLDWTPNTNHTGFYVAKEKGYFDEAGIDLDILQPPEGGAEGLVANGGGEFGVSFQDTIAASWAKDDPLPVTAVAALLQHNTSGLLSAKDKGIDSMGKLTGHSYATWNFPIELAMMKTMVNDDGGNFDKVELIPSNVTDIVAALKSNVDAVWVYYGWDGIATEDAGLETNYIPFIDSHPEFDYYSPILIANNDFLKDHPDTAKKALAAIAKGYEYAAEHPDEAAEILIKSAPELSDKENFVKKSQAYVSKEYIADADRFGVIDAKRWNTFYQWLADNKLVEQAIPEDFGFSNDYLPE